jgi:NAD(P)-dependent dehydrogenase (short-subunit alcohol dehydrogenase family)
MDKLKSLAEMISLKGKKALITGCAHGIGEAIALRFAEAGADLELVDIDIDNLNELQPKLAPFNTTVNIHRVDLSKKDEIDALWEKLKDREPDILVNNAGLYPFIDFREVDTAFLSKVADTNLYSVFWMCQQIIKRRGNRGGIIINFGTIEAILPFASGLVPYNISKAGVIALTRALAKEYAKDGYRINAIIPGGIVTQGTKNVAKELLKLNFKILRTGMDFQRRLPVGRGGQPDEVARMAVVLASDLASYVHGALIPVDGGFLST